MTIHSVVIQKLLSTNAHIGRQVATHHFKDYTYGLRNRMAIIDSDKTLICMRSAINFISSLARHNGRFMFINTNPLFDEIFELMSKKVGCYSPSSNSLWRTGGFLTNSNSPKKFRSRNKKLCFGPTQPPDCIVIVDTESKSSVIDEAFKLHIPIVALVDSAMPLHTFSRIAYPIPVNPSVQFVYLFCNLITKTLLLEKNNNNNNSNIKLLDDDHHLREKQAAKEKSNLAAKLGVTVIPYDAISPLPQDVEQTKNLLDKLVVLKLNHASGTNMGFQNPKSAMDICDGQTFLDLIINQIETLDSKYGSRVPLLIFNKDDTHDSTLKVLEKYSESSIDVRTFKQGKGPELTLSDGHSSKEEVHTFDNGDIFRSLMIGGTLDLLLSQGKEYIFVMKCDNVGTIIDPNILNHLMTNAIDYCMEVTPSHSSNVILTPMNFKLKEIVRNQDKDDKCKLIDTTNMWVSLRTIKRLFDTNRLKLQMPPISKEDDYDQTLLQGTDAGQAVQFFDNVIGVSIPESRFVPLDTTSDLLLLQSDLYTSREGVLARNPARTDALNPVIDLGPEYEKIADFRSRFKSIPSIVGLDSLIVRGDVWFGANITLKGHVTIVAKPGLKLEIPDGVVIENKEINDIADIQE
ncbi:UTP--glucose-1-phosphate uridylyltransferase isoform X2 [Medicago truncatula]|uniref:UTP--glucose-1-phosphate uridylyltransferase n=1 Tax=Medicago truncatula TaxID=3880 RepID=A0A072VE37_MEDTR|nr:UTP--glucose-1-phosphate uridylyltransferase isoform X2 [Medicago truncatula]KEH36395.1 UTP-glucose-1-phosphate uridylyltransferase [Medicago truncatula]